MKCPIKGVSEDCGKCKEADAKLLWKRCVYVKVWKERKKGIKSTPYEPLTGCKMK